MLGGPRKPARATWWGGGQDPVVLDLENSIDPNREMMRRMEGSTSMNPEDFSFQSNNSYATSDRPSNFSHYQVRTPQRNLEDELFVVPLRGSETPVTRAKLSVAQGSATPDLQRKLSHAHTEDVQEVAMRMFKVLKEHGLADEARKALQPLSGQGGLVTHYHSSDSEDPEELVGMDYILKDGIVKYLRDVAKLAPPLPQQVVRFSDIKYTTMTELPPTGFETFGAKLFSCFFGVFVSPFKRKEKPTRLEILKNVTGYVMPGSMTLLLGPPGSGKSSLLKVLAGRAETNKTTTLEGTILFNDRYASDILLTRLIAYINGQLNKHLPFLTVRETLEFAGDCSQGLRPENFTPQMRKFFAQALVEGQDPYLEYILHVLGLKGIEHRLVGAGQDGITESDRNRLTTAEIAMGTYAVMLYDQPCSGQDSLATYDLVSTLRAIGRFQQCSAVMSLVECSPEVFDLFDRIILLGEGQVLYQGPRQDMLAYFGRLGFKKPVHVDAGDFLMEIAAGEGSQYLIAGYSCPSIEQLATLYKLSDMHKDVLRIVHSEDVLHTFWVESEPNLGLSVKKRKPKSPNAYREAPDPGPDVEVIVSKLSSKGPSDRSHGIESTGSVEVGDLVTGISLPTGDMYYLNIDSGNDKRSRASGVASMLANARGHVRLQLERLRDPETMDEEERKAVQFTREYVQPWKASTSTLISRQIKVSRRVALLMQLRLFQVFVMGLFAGSLFYATGGKYLLAKMTAVRSVGFVTTMNLMMVSLVQLPLYMMQRPTFYKQREQRFFRVSSYIVGHSVVGIPQSLLEAFTYATSVYFLVGLDSSNRGAVYFQYLLIQFLVSCFGTSLVLVLSGLSALLEQANGLAGLLVSLFLLFSGFVIFPSNMPSFWRWAAYANPLRWANVAFCVTQFQDLYKEPCTDHIDDVYFCTEFPNKSVGYAFLTHAELKTDANWYWISISIMVGWIIFMQFLAYLVYQNIRHMYVVPSLPSQTVKAQHMPRSFVTDAKHETASGISWAGYIIDGADDQNFALDKTRRRKELPQSFDYDLEASVDPSFHLEKSLSWRSGNLPVMPTTLSFHNLTFTVKDPKTQQLTVRLNRVSGYAKPGKLLALMGGNKSGKTTLLKCLAGRGLEVGEIGGDILVNGFKLNSATFSRAVGFAERLDAHQPFLTVKESLMFSAALRLGNLVSKEDRFLHVELILDLLDLTAVANHLVGSLRDASGRTFELSKKITIAVELAANPSVLFLDEPTSGLDGLGARNVIHAIQTIAGTGRTVVTTIQHPSSRMLSAFNSVIILSSGGRQVYFGPVGSNCSQLLEYFGSIPKVPQYDKKKNPVTYVFDILGCGIKTRDPIHDFSEVYRSSSLAILNNEELNLLRKQNKRQALKLESSGYAATFRVQAFMVFLRTQRFLWRNVGYTFGRIVSAFAVGLLLGSVYFQIKYDETSSLTSRSLFIYMQVMLIGVVTANNVVPQLGTDRLAYFREKRAGMYRPILYPVSWAIAEVPYLLISSLFFVAIGNGLAGVGTDSVSNFVKYWMALFVFTLAMAYFGMLITLATPVPMLASFTVSICTSLWVSASGVVISLPIFQKGWIWLFWADPFQYITNTLTTVSFFCDVQKPECLACIPGQPCPACGCVQVRDKDFSFSWFIISKSRAIDESRLALDFAALTGMAMLFAVLAFLAFVSLKHNKS